MCSGHLHNLANKYAEENVAPSLLMHEYSSFSLHLAGMTKIKFAFAWAVIVFRWFIIYV